MSEYVQIDTVVNDFMVRLMNAVEAQKTANDALGQLYQAIEKERRLNDVRDMLYMSMAGYQLVREETALSTQTDDNAYMVKSFLAALKVEGRTEKTIAMYWGELKNLFLHVNRNYRDIKTNDIRQYLAYCKAERHNSDVTVNNKIHVFSSFFSWLQAEEYITTNPMAKIKIAKTERRLKKVLTDAQVEIIRCGCTCKRDLAIIELLAATGMRVGELVGLDRSDIDITAGRCVVYGKGRKERPVYLTGRAMVHVQEYLDTRTDNAPALVVGKHRKRNQQTGELEYKRLTTDAVRGIINDIVAADSRLKGINVHPHMFRRYLATSMHKRGARAEEIQQVLGHNDVGTTMMYIETDERSVREAHSKYAA